MKLVLRPDALCTKSRLWCFIGCTAITQRRIKIKKTEGGNCRQDTDTRSRQRQRLVTIDSFFGRLRVSAPS